MAFKGCRQGLRLVLPPDGDFQSICAGLAERLSAAGEFFRGAKVLLDQSGRLLLPQEIQALKKILIGHGLEAVAEEPRGRGLAALPSEATVTVRAPVRTGQRVAADGNILVLGDVHPGAEILAGCDVVVLGTAKGAIAAGLVSGREASVFAFELRPSLLRLGDLVARPGGAGPAWRPEIARVREQDIVVEPFTGWQPTKTRRRRKP